MWLLQEVERGVHLHKGECPKLMSRILTDTIIDRSCLLSGVPPEVGLQSGEIGAGRRTRLKGLQRGSGWPEAWSWGQRRVHNKSC